MWALPTPGGPGDFPRLVELVGSLDPAAGSGPSRLLFAIRWKLGELLGWDEPGTAPPGTTLLRDRLPADLRDTVPAGLESDLPFEPVYVLADECAAEIANRTVHGVLHLGWVPDEDGRGGWHGQMAVLVRRNGLLGAAYLAAIEPFRHLVVYPAMMRTFAREWARRAA